MLNDHVGLLTQVIGRYFIPPYHPPEAPYVKFSEKKLNAYYTAEKAAEYLIDNDPPFGYFTKTHQTLFMQHF